MISEFVRKNASRELASWGLGGTFYQGNHEGEKGRS